MSLYESLDVFVGAGLIALAPVAGCQVPSGQSVSGGALSAHLRARGDGAPFGEVLDRLAHQIWLSQDTRGIPMHVAEEHAGKLAPIVSAYRPAADVIELAVGSDVVMAANRLTADVLKLAAGHPIADRIVPEIAEFLLQRLFLEMLADDRFVRGFAAGLAEFISSQGGLPSASQLKAPQPNAPGTALAPARSNEVADLKQRYGLSDKAMERFSAIAEQGRASPARESRQISELAQWLQETRDQLIRPSNEPAEVRRLKMRAAEALTAGDFEAAMDLLKDVRRWLRDERRRTEQRLQEEIGLLRAQEHQEAMATADLAELAMARVDFKAAADLFEEAADAMGEGDAVARLRFMLRRADALCYAGEDGADPQLLRNAANAYARAAELAGNVGDAKDLAAASQGLGNALLAVAEHEPSQQLYEQAGIAYRSALEVLTRETDPRVWALARMGLGNALASMSEIETSSTAVLEQATVAYKGALEVFTREAEPMRWAVTRLNMATVLFRLGEMKDRRENWLAAAAAIVPALEVFEEQGATAQADAARHTLQMLHRRWGALEAPTAAE
jgi:tetratricopeptide (TPR) repeat protein